MKCFLLFLIACGTPTYRVWPVSPEIAAIGTFDLVTTTPSGAKSRGSAFVVDHHHLITAARNCIPLGDHRIAATHPALAPIIRRNLCLLESATDLGEPLILAMSTPHHWSKVMQTTGDVGAPVIATSHDDDPFGDPLTVRSGVIGMVLPDHHYAGLREIKTFLRRNGISWAFEPDVDSTDLMGIQQQDTVDPNACGLTDWCKPDLR